jgi:hypothetical protein
MVVGKHGVALEKFVNTVRPSDLKFERMLIWARVVNLPFNLLAPPWIDRMACQVGKVDKMDVDSKGFAIGGALRVRV